MTCRMTTTNMNIHNNRAGQIGLTRQIFLLILCILLCLTSCSDADDENGSVSPLNIYAYVMDEQIADPNDWTPEINTSLEKLELGEVRLLAPTTGAGLQNINLCFEFDGIVDVISEAEDAQLSVGENARVWDYDKYDDRTFGYSMRINERGYVSVYPIGGGIGYINDEERILGLNPDVKLITGYVGREYYLTVNAYRGDKIDAPVITAELKLVQLEDTTYMGEFTNLGDGDSRFYSIELVSYEMSETYAMELAS